MPKTNKMKTYIYTVALFILGGSVQAQELLTKDEALKITLENNYDIKVIEKNVEVAKNNASIYNSGYLPTASINSGVNYTNNTIEVESQDGAITEASNAISTGYNASIGLNYVLFDGLNRKYSYKKLKETHNLTKLQARQVIESSLLNLYIAYFEVSRLSENENNFKETLAISKRRLLRAEYSADYGQNTKLDVLNAEVDVNNDSISYLNSKRELTNSKRNLNVILGRNVIITDFEVETSVTYTLDLNLEALVRNALNNNVTLLQTNKDIQISNFDVSINASRWLPTITASSSYGYNLTNNPKTSFFAAQEVKGLNAGLTLGWNLFDGGQTKTRVQNSKIAVASKTLEKEQFIQQLTRDVYNAWEFYQNALFKLKVQETNVQTNQRNFERTNEQYKLGQINSIEFRTAQINLLNAERNLSQSKYDAKIAEYQLLYLAGNLLNN